MVKQQKFVSFLHFSQSLSGRIQPLILAIPCTLRDRTVLRLVLLNSAVCVGLIGVLTPRVLAPPSKATGPLQREWEQVKTVADLRRLDQQIEADLRTQRRRQGRQPIRASQQLPVWQLAHLRHQVEARLQLEEQAEVAFSQAEQLAEQALQQRPLANLSTAQMRRQEQLWLEALGAVAQVPSVSIAAAPAATRTGIYQRRLAIVADELDQRDSAFLETIASQLPHPSQVMISVCHVSGECRDYHGDQLPANPASLIKLPIALMLMEQMAQSDQIDLNTEIPVARHNHTESGEGARVFAGQTYPLKDIMGDMIESSNNVAANQLIDYLNRPKLNEHLQAQGYPNTSVHSKLMGDKIRPANLGSQANTTTTNELTTMMRQIYSQPYTYRTLIQNLARQHNQDYAYAAFKQMDDVQWLGEKWGYNSRAMGTTTAVRIQGETYLITIILNRSSNHAVLHKGLQAIAKHILKTGHFRRDPRFPFDANITPK